MSLGGDGWWVKVVPDGHVLAVRLFQQFPEEGAGVLYSSLTYQSCISPGPIPPATPTSHFHGRCQNQMLLMCVYNTCSQVLSGVAGLGGISTYYHSWMISCLQEMAVAPQSPPPSLSFSLLPPDSLLSSLSEQRLMA